MGQSNTKDKTNVNLVGAGAVQGVSAINSTIHGLTVNINQQQEQQSDISQILAPYKKWILDEEENSQLRRKLKQLNVNGELCYIERKLKGNGEEFSAEELLKRIPRSKTSLVTGPAGSGKSILAARTTVDWAESKNTSYDLVVFLSSLQERADMPLHIQIWGEYAGHIQEESAKRIYQDIKNMKDKVLIIIDGLGRN